MKHNFLVIGGGGREHALAWKLAQSPLTDKVYCMPGNAGTAAEFINVPLTDPNNPQRFRKVVDFISAQNISASIIGPEGPLVTGLADYLRQHGHYCFGPGAQAAQLEGSKSFCKKFLIKHNIPTAAYQEFISYDDALNYLRGLDFPQVIKFDGLARGKGVTIAENLEQAQAALRDIHHNLRFGPPPKGQQHLTVIEDFLEGEEISCMIAVQGKDYSIMQTSRDHKPRDDGNKGPNTGGMGAYTPGFLDVAVKPQPLSAELLDAISKQVIEPTIQGLLADGLDYVGFLYAGLITAGAGVKVLEYNCRLGDPEAEPLMLALKSDFAEFILDAKEGRFPAVDGFTWHNGCALSVVMASGGYPDSYDKGEAIQGLDDKSLQENAQIKVFHCGTAMQQDEQGKKYLATDGGRVLAVTSLAEDLASARKLAYDACSKISWDKCFYRKDIGNI